VAEPAGRTQTRSVETSGPSPQARSAGWPGVGARLLSDGRRLYWWREVLTVLAFYGVYSAIRNASEGSTGIAFRHAREVMRWQRMVGVNLEETLQDWALHLKPLVIALNYVYGSLHFVVTAAVIVYLYRRHSDDYPRWRNTLAITTALALIGFVFWPLMPPRLLPARYGFVDTLARYPTLWSFDSGTLHQVSNQYAAMPSLHFAWSLFCACALTPRVRASGWRLAACAYPALTLAAIVLTGNHFFLDAAGGAAVFGAGYLLSRHLGPSRTPPVVDAERVQGEGRIVPPPAPTGVAGTSYCAAMPTIGCASALPAMEPLFWAAP
jgi:hypothetical protein